MQHALFVKMNVEGEELHLWSWERVTGGNIAFIPKFRGAWLSQAIRTGRRSQVLMGQRAKQFVHPAGKLRKRCPLGWISHILNYASLFWDSTHPIAESPERIRADPLFDLNFSVKHPWMHGI